MRVDELAPAGLRFDGLVSAGLRLTGPPFDGPPFDSPPFDGPPFDGPPFDALVAAGTSIGELFAVSLGTSRFTGDLVIVPKFLAPRLSFRMPFGVC